jgi:mannose-6-phosphate isomerase-like protein (cupin superfamily)
MIRKNAEKTVAVREHPFGGDGQITVRSILNNEEELYHKGRVFAHTSVQPGCSIGYHTHTNESETYYILSGQAEFNDNGALSTVSAGDVCYTPSGEGHGIKNNGTEPLELIALILFK